MQRALAAILDTDLRLDWIGAESTPLSSVLISSPRSAAACVLLLLCVIQGHGWRCSDASCMDGLFTVLPAQVLSVSLFGVNAATVSPLLLVLICPHHPINKYSLLYLSRVWLTVIYRLLENPVKLCFCLEQV